MSGDDLQTVALILLGVASIVGSRSRSALTERVSRLEKR